MFRRDFWRALSMIFILLYLLHMKMKKMLLGAFLGMFALAGVAVLPNYASADTTTNTNWNNPAGQNMARNNEDQTGSHLLTTIKKTINWLLWILATIAVVICLYAGFIMVTSAGDEKQYQKGFTILKYAAVWLVIIWLSWIIVSAIYWFIGLQSGTSMQTWAQDITETKQ